MNNEQVKQAQKQWLEYMKVKRMRNTVERKAVFEAVFSMGIPFTVDIMKSYLDTRLPISRVTVYNNLELMYQASIVIKRSIGSAGMEYEAIMPNQTHHHLICTSCHQFFEFKDKTVEPFFAKKKYTKFKMTSCSVTIYGICARCQGRMLREKRKSKQNTK